MYKLNFQCLKKCKNLSIKSILNKIKKKLYRSLIIHILFTYYSKYILDFVKLNSHFVFFIWLQALYRTHS